ncbi:hypothetical protein KGQ20_27355 [Catenulispora sp. NF23]|uniref:hypothetical protein n=1 Tax=Catenulispora pinistramenti TaxID=2705254 RepID=UPI001BA59605|nr:hypothetical protein [Catenulispora pinistramenti]MBS2536484.1 hypothetical protein [Catenulispora pinistramenti]
MDLDARGSTVATADCVAGGTTGASTSGWKPSGSANSSRSSAQRGEVGRGRCREPVRAVAAHHVRRGELVGAAPEHLQQQRGQIRAGQLIGQQVEQLRSARSARFRQDPAQRRVDCGVFRSLITQLLGRCNLIAPGSVTVLREGAIGRAGGRGNRVQNPDYGRYMIGTATVSVPVSAEPTSGSYGEDNGKFIIQDSSVPAAMSPEQFAKVFLDPRFNDYLSRYENYVLTHATADSFVVSGSKPVR